MRGLERYRLEWLGEVEAALRLLLEKHRGTEAVVKPKRVGRLLGTRNYAAIARAVEELGFVEAGGRVWRLKKVRRGKSGREFVFERCAGEEAHLSPANGETYFSFYRFASVERDGAAYSPTCGAAPAEQCERSPPRERGGREEAG
ncbi:MAG: hypothetical protein QXQ60_08530 [Thermofilum sp.]